MRQRVKQATSLGEHLREMFPGTSGRTRKQMLEDGRVRVNGTPSVRAKATLGPGDEVTIDEGPRRARLPPGLTMVHEDDQVVVVDKAAGLLTIATDSERAETAYAYLRAHVKAQDPRAKIFIVHRLDRDVSGLLVFACTPDAKVALQGQFRDHSVERTYRAAAEGRIESDRGRIERRLHEDPISGKVREVRDAAPGVDAVTTFEVVARGAHHTLVDLRLETGRKHQIRVHLAGFGHPIAGDLVYGAKSNPIRRIALHARSVAFDHPRTGQRLSFTSRVPKAIERLGGA